MSATNESVIAEKLLQVGAIQLNVENPFTWASGWKSPIYCDNRKVLSFPFIRDFIKSEMSNVIYEQFPDTEIIAGVATAGIPWGALAADQLKLPFIYVRGKAKEHGLGNQIEGDFEVGKRVVVIEDLISTGKSSIEVVKVLKQHGLQVDAVVSIFSYGYEVSKNLFEQESIDFKSLTNYDSLIKLAVDKGILPAEAEPSLKEWRMNPAEWGKNI